MHENHAADALGLVAAGVEQGDALLELAGVDAGEGENAERIVHDLEREQRERLIVTRATLGLFTSLVINALDGATLDGRRQVIDNRVEKRLNALVLEG